MTIWVCSLVRARELVTHHKPERIISLLSPDDRFPEFEGYDEDRHLRLEIDDVGYAVSSGRQGPNASHAMAIIDFARDWPKKAPMLIHCQAGVSRSAAAAFIVACALNPRAEPADIAADLRRQSLTARPNRILVEMADRLLNRRGRMLAALDAIEDSWDMIPELEVMPYRLNESYPDKGGHV